MPTLLLPDLDPDGENAENAEARDKLLDGLQATGHITIRRANLITTYSPAVVALLAEYGEILGDIPLSPEPAPEPAPHPQPGPPPADYQYAGNTHQIIHENYTANPPADPDPNSEITYTDIATGQVYTVGTIRQMLRYGKIHTGQQFYHSQKGLMSARVGPGYKMKLYVMPKQENLP